ncbi:hypothetical protein BKA63DRAFT_65597 [Paraphoma chrysanthemicola]|nr:hypothetical protein BKA63DRAFT_65597 [Paraphoma chrysanthemicola]
MLLREEDSGMFKRWLLPELETISDADAEVLADYVVALVTTNEPEATIRINCLESLADFLQDHTASFVEDVFAVLKSKSYDTRVTTKPNGTKPQATATQRQHAQAAPIPSVVSNSSADYEPQPSRATNIPPANAPKGPAASRASKAQHHLSGRPNAAAPGQLGSPGANTQQDRQTLKKRKLVDRDTSEAQDAHDSHHTRTGTGPKPKKQAARQGAKGSGQHLRGSATTFEPQSSYAGFTPTPNALLMATLPPPPPGPIPFDMSNPMAFFAMMAALGTAMPGMPSLPAIGQGSDADSQAQRVKCYDYHNKGFCALGSMCQFEHGDTDLDVPKYDPVQPSLETQYQLGAQPQLGPNNSFHKSAKGGRPRANFSLPGPSYDRSNTTLVVEQIPQKDCSEDTVRGFFSQFGSIVEVQMHAFKRLAIVKYEDHAAANNAYNSPKAVFDNRFVKVYWYRHDASFGASTGSDGDVVMSEGTAEPLDLEAIAKRQAEAQKAFEERRQKMARAEARAAEIERLLQEKDEEMTTIKKQLADLAQDETDGTVEAQYAKDLATLQAEAEGLFAENEALPSMGRGRGTPPRGAYPGIPRGRGFSPYSPHRRGGPQGTVYRGRGGFNAVSARGKSSVKRLDNRPRRLAVANIEKGTTKDEALRQYLVNVPECIRIEQHPHQANTLILAFQERYQAESFLDASRTIPDASPLELAWVPNDAFGGLSSAPTTGTKNAAADGHADASDDDSSATVGGDEKADGAEESAQQAEDMDVAEDEDQWL